MEWWRSLAGKKGTVYHLLFLDVLDVVSIFIEPGAAQEEKQALRHQGGVHIYTRTISGYKVTVLGETPAETVMRFARALEPRTTTAVQQR